MLSCIIRARAWLTGKAVISLFVFLRCSSCPFVDIFFPFIACRSEAMPREESGIVHSPQEAASIDRG